MLISVKTLIKESWQVYKKNLVPLVKISAWLFIPTILMIIFSMLNINPVIGVPLNMLFSVASLVLGIFISIALILAINNLRLSQKINMREIYGISYSKILSAIWVSFLSFLAAIIAMFISVLPTILGLTLKNWLPAQGTILAVCYALSAVLFVTSSIALGIYLSFSLYSVAIEGTVGKRALYRSKDLVIGRFWPILWRWFASYIILGFLFLIITLVPIYLIGLAIGDIGAGFATVTPWWANLVSNIIYIVVVPLFAAIGVILYNSVRGGSGIPVKQE